MTIEEYLEQWKQQSLFGERQFKKLGYTLVEGQSLYQLSYRAKVSVDDVEKTIEMNRFFQTRA